jgi:hypothetical protein
VAFCCDCVAGDCGCCAWGVFRGYEEEWVMEIGVGSERYKAWGRGI